MRLVDGTCVVNYHGSARVPLAEAELPIFVISTFESDYVLVRSSDLGRAADALEDAGHEFGA